MGDGYATGGLVDGPTIGIPNESMPGDYALPMDVFDEMRAVMRCRETVEDIKKVIDKYRPTLESCGILDGLLAYQEVMLYLWLYERDKEIEDAVRGVPYETRRGCRRVRR